MSEFQVPVHTPSHESGEGLSRTLRTFVRNSPWIAIATSVHVIGVAVLGLVHFGSHEREEANAPTVVDFKPPAPDLPDLSYDDPPELIERTSIPVLPDQEEGIVNPAEKYIEDAPPGRPGEVTDETDPTKEPGIYNPNPDTIDNVPSGEPSGTSIGVGLKGHIGSGTPSPYATRRLGAGGPGGGGIGQGGGGGRGGSRRDPFRTATLSALLWLKNHQSSDGRWDADGFDGQCKQNKCSGHGESVYDPGLTGLALLCFLGAGETHQSGIFRPTVREGLKYLRNIQDTEGCFGPRTSQHFQYNHAISALAMAEAYGMTQSTVFLDTAQRGINFVHQSQNPYLAWRYGVRDGDNDTSVTGWMVMALKSGVMSGLEVDKGAFTGAMGWVDKMTEPEFGKVGYQQRGGPPARTVAMQQKFPASNSESMTAVGVLTRIFAGHTMKDDPAIRQGAELMSRQLPRWDVDAGTIDFYYWYYGTLAMFQVGQDSWKKWNDAMKVAIVDHQRLEKDRCEFGSWDPEDPWSPEGGRVYATALNCLCTEVYYRYGRVFGTDTGDGAPK